jgi:hypothetical protein
MTVVRELPAAPLDLGVYGGLGIEPSSFDPPVFP